MSYPPNPPDAYPFTPGDPAAAANAQFTAVSGYSSDTASGTLSGGTNSGTDYSTDGSTSNSNGNAYVEYPPASVYHHHLHQQEQLLQQHQPQQLQNQYQHQHHHTIVPGPYPPQTQYHPYPSTIANAAYDHPEQLYPAVIPQQQQQQQQRSPSSMAPPTPQDTHPAPTQAESTTPVVPALPQGAPTNKQQQAQQQQYQRIARFVGPPPVALACTECRSRHLKCDAGIPSCNRCISDGRECSYVKSRRGWKGTRRKKAAAAAAAAAAAKEEPTSGSDESSAAEKKRPREKEQGNANNETSPPIPLTALPTQGNGQCTSFSKNPLPITNTPSTDSADPPTTTNPLNTLRAYHKNSTTFLSPQELSAPAPSASLLQLYFAYFHSAHPFILPPTQFTKTPVSQLMVLLPVMRFVASFFAQSACIEDFRKEAETALFTNSPPRNAFTVQALLLFAIGLHSDNDQEKSAEVKDAAIELALDLGMNMREFSERSCDGTQPGRIMAESLRRTWWELYYLDGLLAGFHQKDSFKLWSMPCTVPLPCEEIDYATGRIPEAKSLKEFDDRYFALETTVFSSFAYRVDAVRILGQVLAVGQGDNPEDPNADAADASLVNWGLHLPKCKKELVGNDRRVDEMLFQAHMVIHAATIYLHRPKSHLAISIVPDDTSCTPCTPSAWATSPKPRAMHTAKAITAANTIAKLITLPAPLIKHTPFFTCVITLAAIVHLSACSWLLQGDEGFLAKERIRLGVGALKTLGEVWSVADCVLMQVKGVAREVFSLQIPAGTQRSAIITEEEVFKYIDSERTLEIVGGEADYHGLPELSWNGEWGVPLA